LVILKAGKNKPHPFLPAFGGREQSRYNKEVHGVEQFQRTMVLFN
jgi:hypothetical protein